jgi:hypothetical protein
MKISNIHVGTNTETWGYQTEQFHIFISVSYFHISFIFSYQFHILTFRCMVPTWTFDIFISVSYFHISFKFSPFDVWFLRGRLIFSYQFDIFISVSYFHISLQFSCHNSITSLCVASQPVSHGPIETDNFPMLHGGIDHTRRRQTST